MSADECLRVNVNRLLYERRITARRFAHDLGHSSSWASNFLNGKKTVPIDTAEAIAAYLQVPLPTLFLEGEPGASVIATQLTNEEPSATVGHPSTPAEELSVEKQVQALFALLPDGEKLAVLTDMRSRVRRALEAPVALPKLSAVK